MNEYRVALRLVPRDRVIIRVRAASSREACRIAIRYGSLAFGDRWAGEYTRSSFRGGVAA